jgi:uncharacterized protein YecE (DUF72 family)
VHAHLFPRGATALERYARVFDAVEVNSTFYRTPRPGTCQRWADSVPAGFRFSLKLPRALTHYARLRDPEVALDDFFTAVAPLVRKLGAVLAQLPPTLALDEGVADAFFAAVRQRVGRRVVVACEPRHASWAGDASEALWKRHRLARVAADPSRFDGDALPAGARPAYWRWHGAPRIYYDRYDDARLEALAAELRADPEAWAIFDNTASGQAIGDALRLRARLQDSQGIAGAPPPREAAA